LRVEKILTEANGKSIAIIGDICLDLYYFQKQGFEEISVETQLKSNSVCRVKHELGGAGNVAVNCKSLGISNIDLYGIIGDDPHGETMISMLRKAGISINGVLKQPKNWLTHVYHKVYDDDYREQPRLDIGNFNIPDSAVQSKLLSMLEEKISSYQVVIINEQVQNGMHDSFFQDSLNNLIEKHSDTLWISDCRKLNHIYKKTIHKLNNHEGLALLNSVEEGNGKNRSEYNAPTEIASLLYQYWKKPVFLTCGKNGVVMADQHGTESIPGIHLIQTIDTVGAGDAFLSGLAAGFVAGANHKESAELGNFAATISVQKLYETGHPDKDEVIALSEDTDYLYNTELASDYRQAVHYNDTDIEIINPDIVGSFSGNFPRVAIFDHDGTISVLRQGWEEIMTDMMIKSIAGKQYDSISHDDLADLKNQVHELIDQTTGVQTIIQMHELVRLIRENGYVPEKEILTPREYKDQYNQILLIKVNVKRNYYDRGKLSLDDVTMKDSVKALKLLHDNGSLIFLASGTDVEDVRDEAEFLGYAGYFTGGIHGSVGDVSQDPKRKVIKHIISQVETQRNAAPSQCIVFGDGPVEMREAKKHGMTAVGILSDEKQRHGVNLEKRERLVLAGADILIPDFSWFKELASVLRWHK